MQEKFQKAFDNLSREVSLDHFQQFVIDSSQHAEELFVAIRECRTQGFPRFNIWRMLLEVIPLKGTWQQKKKSLEASRRRWQQLREESKTGIKKTDKPKEPVNVPKNPLMKLVAKPQKKQVQSDSFLTEQIKKDVDRTYQEMAFFQDPQILKLLQNVLFVWCKANPDISYKQGMHQLLAEVVYVYFMEAVPSIFEASSQVEEQFLFLNSIANAEADVFIVFEKIMDIQKDMYKENLDDEFKGLVNPNSKNNSPILQRIVQIQDQKLKFTDLELFRVLKLQDVKTKTFLLRWIRCLHTREFGLVNSLFIWDSIFLDAFESPNSKNRKQYEFVDAMCLAMFIYLRAVVLTRETSNQILQVYQKYPQLEGQYLSELIRLAWSVCEELRSQATNPSGSNWYEESEKVKKLGLMEKGGYALMKKQQSDKKLKAKDHHLSPSPMKEETLIRKSPLKEEETEPKQRNGKETPKVPQKTETIIDKSPSPLPLPKEANDDKLFKTKQKGLDKVEKTKESKKQPSPPPVFRPSRTIQFQEKELMVVIENLKRSIDLNEQVMLYGSDIQSRALANKALKVLEGKINPK